MTAVDFYFDCSSPWTYLGFHNFEPLIERFQFDVNYLPILVGGLFNTVNPSVYASRENPVPAKLAYAKHDMQAWAKLAGLRITHPPSVFPVNSVKAMRGCIAAAERGRLIAFARATFEAYWGDDKDISQDAEVAAIARAADLDPDWLALRIAEDDIKQTLKDNTQACAKRGGFGSPTWFVDRAMFFGNDRLPLLEAKLEGRL